MDTESILKSYSELATQILTNFPCPSSSCLPQTQSTQFLHSYSSSELSPSSLNQTKFYKFQEVLSELISLKLSPYEVYQITGKNGYSAKEELVGMIVSLLENPEQQLEEIKLQRNMENICLYTNTLPDISMFNKGEIEDDDMWNSGEEGF
jgi:hypothetical protein